MKILVETDEPTGMVFAHRVASKGPSDPWIANRIVKDIEELGRRDVILKTDGEPAIVGLQRTAAKPENPLAYNPSSNGACAKAVQDVSNLVRTLKLALEAPVGIANDDNGPVVDWIIEHAAFLWSRFAVGRDGVTPLERLTGRKWTQAVAEFGEIVLAKLALSKVGCGKRGAQKT